MMSTLFSRVSRGRCCRGLRESVNNDSWSRLAVMDILLGLVALENVPLTADRLQPFSDQRRDLEQPTDGKTRTVLDAKVGGTLERHPRGDAESLTVGRFQHVGRRRPPAVLLYPERLAYERMKWVLNPDAVGICILLRAARQKTTVITANYRTRIVAPGKDTRGRSQLRQLFSVTFRRLQNACTKLNLGLSFVRNGGRDPQTS